MSKLRIALALFGFVSVFFLPAWVTLTCIVALAIYYRSFEAIILGLLMDLVWFAPSLGESGFLQSMPVYTLLAILAVWLLEPLRLEFMK